MLQSKIKLDFGRSICILKKQTERTSESRKELDLFAYFNPLGLSGAMPESMKKASQRKNVWTISQICIFSIKKGQSRKRKRPTDNDFAKGE